MAHFLVRAAARGPSSPPGPNVRVWRERHVLISLRLDTGPTEHDVHDGPDGLCVVVGRLAGRWRAVDVHRCYREAGPAAVARRDGQFVVLLHDRLTHQTHVVRDQVGFGHAYHWARGEDFGISTDLPWLVRDDAGSGGPLPRPSARGVALYLTYQYIPAPETAVHGVSQLTAGTVWCAGPGSAVALERVAQFPGPPASADTSDGPDSLRAYGDRVIELLTEDLDDQLDDRSAIGVTMSGGMDTSTNAVVAVERLGLRPTAFTAAFRERFYDESSYAALVANHFGLDHVLVTIGPEMIDALPEVVRAFETPNADQAAFAEHFLARAAREHGCQVVVTGEGGDEVLGPPQSHTDDLEVAGLPALPAELARYYLGKTDLADATLRKALYTDLGVAEDVAFEPLADIYRENSRSAPFDRILHGQWRTWMVDGVYMKDSRVFAHSGVRAVLPMMSPALMRYVASLPLPVRLSGLADKRFLRAAVGERLPDQILTRAKHKFWLPFAEWFRGPARDMLADTLLSDGVVTDLFGRDLAARLVAEHGDPATDHSRVLWALLFLQLWWSQHITSTKP